MNESDPQDRPRDWRENMRSMRNRAKLSQTRLAHKMGTQQSAVSELETGLVSPTVTTLEKYAQAIGCTLIIKFIPEHEGLEQANELRPEDEYHSSTSLDCTGVVFRRASAGAAASLLAHMEHSRHDDPYTPGSRILRLPS